MFVFPTSHLSNGIMSCYSVVVHNSIIGQTKETQELSIHVSSEGLQCLLKGHVHRIARDIQLLAFSGKGELTTVLLNGG